MSLRSALRCPPPEASEVTHELARVALATAAGLYASVRRQSTVMLALGSHWKRPVNGLRVSGGASSTRRPCRASVSIAQIHGLSAHPRGPGRARCGAGTAKPPGADG